MILRIFLVIISAVLLTACPGADTTKKGGSRLLLIAEVKTNDRAAVITSSKVEGAMNIIGRITKKYTVVPGNQRDSVIGRLKDMGIDPTAQRVAEEIDADGILFFNISRLENILRVDISEVNTGQSSIRGSGTGYAALRFRQRADEKIIYDPSLLEATQRAFAIAEKDSFIFARADAGFQVLPAQTMVIGGLDFQNDETKPKWELFDKKQVMSYDVSETMFSAAKDNRRYVVFDIATRDSIYALFNLHMVENYRPPSNIEINALSKLEVAYYITGSLKRTDEGALVTIYKCLVRENNLEILSQVAGTLKEDSLTDLRKLLSGLTVELLNK